MNKCEHWWYKEQENGLCKKEAWRKNTAIAVPIIVVVLVSVIVMTVLLVKKKKTPNTRVRKSPTVLK